MDEQGDVPARRPASEDRDHRRAHDALVPALPAVNALSMTGIFDRRPHRDGHIV
jgi:hypothetical protein